MCDGSLKSNPMELSPVEGDTIVQSAAAALSHGMFEAVLMLGIRHKIMPGLLIELRNFALSPPTSRVV